MKKEELYTLEQLSQVVQKLITVINPLMLNQSNQATLITLTGDLGAGKTTLVKELLRNYGVKEEILSPTFTYVNCYKNDQGRKIYHFDLYRVSSLNQFSELGFDEYLCESNSLCLIEWPAVIAPILENLVVCRLEIEHIVSEQRKLLITS
jgi:tRNA threonylcarbamoyladenosine biosynthesis protein TsaE